MIKENHHYSQWVPKRQPGSGSPVLPSCVCVLSSLYISVLSESRVASTQYRMKDGRSSPFLARVGIRKDYGGGGGGRLKMKFRKMKSFSFIAHKYNLFIV